MANLTEEFSLVIMKITACVLAGISRTRLDDHQVSLEDPVQLIASRADRSDTIGLKQRLP
jgi:hypothetical protein